MVKNILGPVIRDLRKERHLTQSDLSKLTGIAQNTISNHENQNRTLDETDIQKYATALSVSPRHMYDLINDDNSDADDIVPIYNQLESPRKIVVYDFAQAQLQAQKNYPADPQVDDQTAAEAGTSYIVSQETDVELFGSVSAGTGEYLTDDDTHETVAYHGHVPEHDFAVRVNGDSMTPLFEDQQIIFVKQAGEDPDFHNGQIVIARLNGDGYVKKLDFSDDGHISLISLNTKYEPIHITDDCDFAVIGTVIL